MLYSVFVFILLVLLSGAIAYLGDYIGRYLGKKRLTVFGLRPKHTAIFSTIITGMLISFLVLMFLTFINKEFKTVVFHGQQIMKNNVELEKQSKILFASNKNLKTSNDILRNSQKDLKLKSSKLEKEARELYIKYNQRKKELERAQNAKKAAEIRISTLKLDIQKQQKELKATYAKDIQMTKLLREKQASLDKNKIELDKQVKDLNTVKLQLSDAKTNLDNTLKSLNIANLELENYTQLRLNNVIIRQDDEIIRGVISNKQSLSGIEKDLAALITDARVVCGQLNKRVTGKDQKSTSMILAYKSEKGEIILWDEASLISQMAKTIKDNSNDNDSFVIISSAGNFTQPDLEKDPIVAQMKLHEDVLIYKKDALVVSKYFDGKLNEPYIFSDVYSFMNTDLPETLLKAGFVPVQQSIINNNATNITSKIEVLLNVTKDIKNTDSMCVLNVYAKTDLYSANIYSPNNFNFEVLKVK